MGKIAPVVMSILVFGGTAQFAALSVLSAGGAASAAIAAGLLMNARFLPMGMAIGPSLPGGALLRAARGQASVDTSWAIANQRDGRFDHKLLVGATLPQAAAWIGGTAIGALGGALLAEPERFGLDAIFPAFYLALLVAELRGGRAVLAAGLGAAIALVLLPIAPPGLPVLAAAAAALIGLRRA
jgi:predicted branched-subunit amino acid permease